MSGDDMRQKSCKLAEYEKKVRMVRKEGYLNIPDAQKQQAGRSPQASWAIWQGFEFPLASDTDKPLGDCDADAILYAENGRGFAELAKQVGAIRAKSRHRGEWRAYCYGQGLAPATRSAGSAFVAELAAYHRERKEANAPATGRGGPLPVIRQGVGIPALRWNCRDEMVV